MKSLMLLMLLLGDIDINRARVVVTLVRTDYNTISTPCLPDKPKRSNNRSASGMSLVLDEPTQSGRYLLKAYSGKNCQYCKQAHELIGDGDSRIVVDWTEDSLPKVIKDRLKQPYNFPVYVWTNTDNNYGWPRDWKLYTLDELVEMCGRNNAKREQITKSSFSLKDFARTYRGPTVGVVGMTVRQHLMDSRHNFTSDQLAGLTDNEMLAIHSADHNGDLPRNDDVVAGVIQGNGLIDNALSWWRSNLLDSTASVIWTRNGNQTLPLFRLKEWTTKSIYGTSGSFDFTAKGQTNLPIKDARVAYRLVGDEVKLSGETTLPITALNVNNTEQNISNAQPVGFVDPMTVFSVISVIWQLLHPIADVTLPGTVSATAVLVDDTLVITFKDKPSIRIAVLFTFNLAVDRVDVKPDKVKLVFSGSRWVKEKTFTVK